RKGRLKEIEVALKELIPNVPIWQWLQHKDRNGVKEGLGFALAIGIAGDFSAYPKKEMLRKRLGLAPFRRHDGITRACSTWRYYGGLTEDEWADDEDEGYKGPGYSPRRRATVYAYVQDSLFRAQWRSADKHPSGVAGPIGPYGKIYGDYKQ